jgi:hypothetical protein
MTMDELDTLRGYGIASVILAFVGIGLSSLCVPDKWLKVKCYINGFAALLGGIGGMIVFCLFSFVPGWQAYFAEKAPAEPVEYQGRHQAAARVIRFLGEMDISTLGILFGILGMVLLAVAFTNFKSLRKSNLYSR